MNRYREREGVSETMGTVLMVGIAVMLVSSVAIYMAGNVKEVESVYVSLSSGYTKNATGSVIIFIENTAGDSLRTSRTTVIIKNASGVDVPGSPFLATDCDNNITGVGVWDGNGLWSPGETWSKVLPSNVIFPLHVKVVYEKTTGEKSVVFSEVLEAPPAALLPDLAIEEFYFLRYGQQSDEVLVGETIDLVATITNLGTQPVPESNITVQFYDRDNYVGVGSPQPFSNDTTPGVLAPHESMYYILSGWSVPYPLGIHRIYARITPLPTGELSTANNYRFRELDVSISIVPTRPSGPNPVVTSKDIQLSKDYPKTGDEVSVTLFIKNLGDQPITYDDDLMVVVSTEPITTEGGEIFNWHDDIPAPEGEDYDSFNPGPIPPDFMPGHPDRVDVWKKVKWAEAHGQDMDGNDYTFPTCKIRHLIIPVAGQISITLTFTARSSNPDKILTLYIAVDANPLNYTIRPPDLWDESLPPQRIVFSSEDETVLQGDDPTDNYASLAIQVIPRILLVDDDEAETGSENDVTSHVIESLTGAGVQVDRVFIAQQMTDGGILRDVPAYEYVNPETVGAPQMKDYDIVIWVTGKAESPLSSHADSIYGGNIEEMMKFMDHGGYLWIIGENVLKGLNDDYMGISPDGENFYNLPETLPENLYGNERDDSVIFVKKYLGITKFTVDSDLPGEIFGESESNPITGWSGNTPYSVDMDDAADGSDNFTEQTYPLEDSSDPLGMLFTQDVEASLKEPYGVYHTHTIETGTDIVTYRVVYLPISPLHIRYLNEKIGVAARIMKWFSWELRIGNDLAISKMELVVVEGSMPPKFMDTVEVRVWVRNNGPDTLSTSVEFYVTGPDGIERRITPNFPDPDGDNPRDILNLPGGGGEIMVTKQWKATSVGLHTFRAVVDPYHIIPEINEENNDITYSTSTVTSLVAQNNILVVDDDGSWNGTYGPNGDENSYDEDNPNNWRFEGGATEPPAWAQIPDTTSSITRFLDLLNLQYEVYRVVNTFDGTNVVVGRGPTVEKMKRYNLIIWNCGLSGGSAYSGIETITPVDRMNITRYLRGDYREAEYMGNYSEAFLLIGRYVLPEIAPNPLYQAGDPYWEFLYNYMGIAGYSTDAVIGTTLFGTTEDDIKTHGVEIPLGSTVNALKLVKRPDNSGVISGASQEDTTKYLYYTDDFDGRNPISISLENSGPSYFKSAHLAFSISPNYFPYLEHRSTEAFYFLVHWFGVEIYQPELYGRSIDIQLDDPHPTVGGNYVLSLVVGNYGGAAGGGTVRFMDGRKLIYSTTIFLEPGDEVTVEAIWTPLFAGQRTVRVFIDFYNNYDEIFDFINNIPSKNVNIYFFYDDMENGTRNFRHESIVARINGESPLDFYDPHMEVNTDVISSWNSDLSYRVEIDQNTSYSHPKSFKLYEPPGGTTRNPLDIVMVLDTSGSMSWEVDGVPKIDRLKEAAKIFISYLTPSDRVAIYTFTNEGYNYPNLFVDWTFCTPENKEDLNDTIDGLWARGWTPLYDTVGAAANKLYPAPSGRMPYLLVFTDGEANRDFNYGPGRYDYENPTDSLGQWMNTYYENYYYSSSAGTSAGNRQGLIMAPFTVYTVGLLSSGYHDSDYPEEEDSDTPPWHTYWQTHNVLTDR
ncbi:MAG: VWA domain-containing protein, partial [Thermoplasmata archaeon]|nr:VWA domain-containing protein [Thermoplasmata archaeon]